MGQQLELAKKRLFDSDSMAVTNFKIYPGTTRETTVEMFADGINKALSQIEAGDFDIANFEGEDVNA